MVHFFLNFLEGSLVLKLTLMLPHKLHSVLFFFDLLIGTRSFGKFKAVNPIIKKNVILSPEF